MTPTGGGGANAAVFINDVFAYLKSAVVSEDILDDVTVTEDDSMVFYAARPVINLRADVEIISGNGTVGNEYIIKTN